MRRIANLPPGDDDLGVPASLDRLAEAPRRGTLSALLDASDCVLAVIDVQEGFLERVEPEVSAGLLERVVLLATSARWSGVPIVATVESPDQCGGLHPALHASFDGVPLVEKRVFGLADDPDVFAEVGSFGRSTVVLVGLESDICVTHSALGLIREGYRVACVADAVASPGSAHDFGLERMRSAGVGMLSTKQVHYEWMRTVRRAREFADAHPEVRETSSGVMF